MKTTISALRATLLSECEVAGPRFATRDEMQIPATRLTGQPLKHGLVHLTVYFGYDSETENEFISNFKINFRPLIDAGQFEEFHSQAMALSKIIDTIN